LERISLKFEPNKVYLYKYTGGSTMKKYDHLKQKAVEWRQKGITLPEICERLSLPKTTVYYWIKDVELSEKQKKRITHSEKKIEQYKKAAESNKKNAEELRNAAYKQGLSLAEEYFKEELFRDFIMLYATEGYRRGRNSVQVANSNPSLVKLAYYWIEKLRNKDRKIRFTLQCHIDNNEKELIKFWSDLLKIDPNMIKITRKSNSGNLSGRKWRSMKGVFSVEANDTYLHSKIEAWMDLLYKEFENI
jgi:predicted DNA-binding transcriptional regulator AlpA